MAGLMWLLGGLSEDKQTQAQTVSKNIEDAQVTAYLSMLEQGEAGMKLMQSTFDKNCMPLVDMQEKTVATMRQQ